MKKCISGKPVAKVSSCNCSNCWEFQKLKEQMDELRDELHYQSVYSLPTPERLVEAMDRVKAFLK